MHDKTCIILLKEVAGIGSQVTRTVFLCTYIFVFSQCYKLNNTNNVRTQLVRSFWARPAFKLLILIDGMGMLRHRPRFVGISSIEHISTA